MKRMLARVPLTLFAILSAAPLQAQVTGASPPPPPPILYIQRELIKPGKSVAHNEWESGWPAAFSRANHPTGFIGMNAVTGVNEAWFLIGFPSFDAMEKDQARIEANAPLAAENRRLTAGESEFVENTRGIVAAYVPEVSYRPNVDIPKMRYFEVLTFVTRSGRDADFLKTVGIVRDGFAKANIDQPFAVYRAVSGTAAASTFYIFLPMRSLSSLDKGPSNWEAMIRAVGPEQMATFAKLSSEVVVTEQNQIFAFNPKMSYLTKEMKASDPAFWK